MAHEEKQIHFDVLLIHNINRVFINLAEKTNAFEYLKKAKDEGKALKVGISFHDKSDLLEEILEKYSDILDIVQIQLNYLDWKDQRVQSKKCHELCIKYGVEIIVMEPIKGGTLVNISDSLQEEFIKYDNTQTLSKWALRFAGSQENVSVVLSGMGNLKQMKENCKTFKDFKKLNQTEHDFLMHMAREIKRTVAIDCSFCNYCIKECPMNIPIPDFFNLYNSEKIYHLEANVALYHTTATTNSPASSCIKCGKCSDYCTQQLDIPNLLEKVTEYFE